MKKNCLNGIHIFLQNPYVPFRINGAFTYVRVTRAIGTNTPPYHHRCRLLKFALRTIRTALFLFALWDKMSMISQNNLTRQTTGHSSTLSQSISNGGVSGCCCYTAFGLHSRVLNYIWRWSENCKQTMVF